MNCTLNTHSLNASARFKCTSIDTIGFLERIENNMMPNFLLHKWVDQKVLTWISQNLIDRKLWKIDISHSSGISGNLSVLLCHHFLLLNSLILSDCRLNSTDLRHLSQARVEGRLPQLKYLDISENNFFLDNFFEASWNQLLWLNITGLHHHNTRFNCFQPLQRLSLSSCRILNTGCWPKLQTLCINNSKSYVMEQVATAAEQGYLPAIKNVCVQSDNDVFSMLVHHSAFHRLVKSNISIHKAVPPRFPFLSITCICQSENPPFSVDYSLTRIGKIGKSILDFLSNMLRIGAIGYCLILVLALIIVLLMLSRFDISSDTVDPAAVIVNSTPGWIIGLIVIGIPTWLLVMNCRSVFG